MISLKLETSTSGASMFDLGRLTTVKGVSHRTRSPSKRPFFARVTANAMGACLLEAHQAVVDHMAKAYTLRVRDGGLSFIQRQVRILKKDVPKASHWPEIKGALTIKAIIHDSPDKNRPLIMSSLEGETERGPFVGKSQAAMPISETAREGGTFKGRVMESLRLDRMNLRRSGTNPNVFIGEAGGYHVLQIQNGGRLMVFRRAKNTRGQGAESELIYYGMKPTAYANTLHFYETAGEAAQSRADFHLGELLGQDMGKDEIEGLSDAYIERHFKYGKQAFRW